MRNITYAREGDHFLDTSLIRWRLGESSVPESGRRRSAIASTIGVQPASKSYGLQYWYCTSNNHERCSLRGRGGCVYSLSCIAADHGYRPSHLYNGGTEEVGVSPSKKVLHAPSKGSTGRCWSSRMKGELRMLLTTDYEVFCFHMEDNGNKFDIWPGVVSFKRRLQWDSYQTAW